MRLLINARNQSVAVAGGLGLRVKVGDDHGGVAIGDTAKLGVSGVDLLQMTDDQTAPDHVEGVVRQRQGADVAHQGLQAGPVDVQSNTGLQHIGAQIHAHRRYGAGPEQAAALAAPRIEEACA